MNGHAGGEARGPGQARRVCEGGGTVAQPDKKDITTRGDEPDSHPHWCLLILLILNSL